LAFLSRILLKSEADTKGFSVISSSIRDLGRDANNFQRRFFTETERGLSGFNRAVLGIRTGLLETAGGFILGSLIQQGTSALIEFGKSFIQVSSDVQQFKLQFTNLFKSIGLSAEEAGEQTENAFAFAKETAKETPFDLPEITQAILRLETFGLSVEKNLGRAIDLASALHAPLEEVVQAFTNLQSRRFGEAFEQFARFGIARDLLEGKGLEFDRNGSYQGSVNQAMTAVQEIIDERFSGFAESQQGTFSQLTSNLRDISFQLKEAFGGPIFEGINEDLNDFVNTLSENQTTLEAFGVAFGELFAGARETAVDSFKGILSDAIDGPDGPDAWLEWGTSLLTAFAEGILEGGKFVIEAATAVAEGIAFFFEAFSPPKGGPLKDIDTWGANLMNTFLEGFQEGDLSILSDVLDGVKAQFDSLVDIGAIDTETPEQDFLRLAEIIVEGFDAIAAGGEGADEIFRQLSEVIGDSAFKLQELVQLGQEVGDLESAISAANDELERTKEAFDDIIDGLQDELSLLRELDNERREEENNVWDAEQDRLDAEEDAANAAIDARNEAAKAAQAAAREASQAQIEALNEQKEGIDAAADAAVALVESQRDMNLAAIDAAQQALDDQVTAAERALEDFDFETEGIPERFTRQRRNELERIALIRKREAEDAKKAAEAEKKAINDQAKLEIDNIKKNADAQKKAIDDQIKGIRDAISAIGDEYEAVKKVNREREKRPKFIPNPRIKELEDEIDKLKDLHEDEIDRQQDIIDGLKDEKDAKLDAIDAINSALQAQLDLQDLIAAALKEQQDILDKIAKDAEGDDGESAGILPIPTDREISLFNKPLDDFNAKLDEARAKLSELIPQDVRDDIKKDIEFFGDFFQGLLGIANKDGVDREGFIVGSRLREALGRINTAFREEIIPILVIFKDSLVEAANLFGNILDGIDNMKTSVADFLTFLGLDKLPFFDKIIEALNKPIREDLAVVSGFLLFMKLTPFLNFKILFSVSTTLLGLALRFLPFLLSLMGGSGGLGAAGLAALSFASIPLVIGIAILISLAILGYIFRKPIANFLDDVWEFLKSNKIIAAAIAGVLAPFTAFIAIPLTLFLKFDGPGFISNVVNEVQGYVDTLQTKLSDILSGIGGGISAVTGGIGDFLSNPASLVSGFSAAIVGVFSSTVSTITGFATDVFNLGGSVLVGISSFFSGIGGIIGNTARDVGGFASGLLGGITSFVSYVGGPLVGAIGNVLSFLEPWLNFFGTIARISGDLLALPYNIFADFLNVTLVPILELIVPKAIGVFVGAFGAIKQLGSNIFGPVVAAVGGGISKLATIITDEFVASFSHAKNFLTDTFLPGLGSVASYIGGGFRDAFTGTITFLTEDFLPGLGSVASAIGGAFASAFTGIGTLVTDAVTGIPGVIELALGGITNTITSVFAPPFKASMDAVGAIVTGTVDNIIAPAFNSIPGIISAVAEPVQNALSPITSAISGAFSSGLDFIQNTFIPFFFTDLPNTLNGFASKVEAFTSSDFLNSPFTSFKKLLTDDILPFLGTIPETVGGFFSGLGTTLAGIDYTAPFSVFATFIEERFFPLLVSIVNNIRTYVTGISTNFGTFVSNFTGHVGRMVQEVTNLPTRIVSAVGTGLTTLYNFGYNVVVGFINGIRAKFTDLTNTIQELVNLIPGPVRSALGLTSPSKLFRGFGKNIVEGLVIGLRSESSSVTGIMKQISDEVSNGFSVKIPDGQIEASRFAKSFLGGVDRELARSPAINAFLKANINQVTVNQEGNKQQIVKTKNNSDTANVVSRIVKAAGN